MSQYFALQFGTGDPRTYGSMAPTFLSFVNMTTGATLTPPAIAEVLPGLGLYQFQYSVSLPIAFLADAATTSPGTAGRYVAGQIDPSDRIDHYGTSILAFGATSIAIGTTLTGYAASLVALGTTNVALGTSSVAIGTTLAGYGVSISAQNVSLFAFGSSNLALATSIYASSSSLFALGTSNLALGTSLDARVGLTSSTFGNSSTDPSTLFGYMKRIQEFLEGDGTFTKASGAWEVRSRGGSVLASKTLANSSSTVTKD